MRRRLALLVLALASCATAAGATTVTVPTNYATIQAALNSGADVINVQPGDYPEDLVISTSVTLQSELSGTNYGRPRVRSLSLGAGTPNTLVMVVSGLHFWGAVNVSGSGQFTVQACQVDGGLSCHSGQHACTVSGTLIRGNATIEGPYSQVLNNQVLGGTLTLVASQANINAIGNYVEGPAAIGINAGDDVTCANNVVRGCTDGIVGCGQYCTVSKNVVEDCTGVGIRRGGTTCGTFIENNTVIRCGGVGISAAGNPSNYHVQGNTVYSSGGTGIDIPTNASQVNDNEVYGAGGDGIHIAFNNGLFARNRVFGCTGRGVVMLSYATLSNNVAGHNGGAGFAIDLDNATFGTLTHNTSFDNGGAGFDFTNGGAVAMDHNIGYVNQYGAQWPGTTTVTLACNDWFGNVGGATSGPSGATDRFLNPAFCSSSTNDVHLSSSSPLASGGCGLVGALGVACATSSGVPPTMTAPMGGLRVSPQPGARELRFAWSPLEAAARIEVVDVAGARRWSRELERGRSELTWDGRDDSGRALPPGMYFARIAGGATHLARQVLIVR
jgi:parallel beta-helix repeat protein